MENRQAAVRRQIANPEFNARLLNKALTGLVVLGAGALLLGGAVLYREVRPPVREYFATNGMQQPVPLRPLSEPVVTRDGLLAWARDCATAAYDIDYVHWPEQARRAQACFGETAWRGFGVAFKRNLETIKEKALTSRPVPLGPPEIVREAVIGDRYTWRVQMPIRVVFENYNGGVPDDLLIDMTISRTDEPEHTRGIAFAVFVAKPLMRLPGVR